MKFTKMHGLGNDFMVVETITQSIDINQLPIVQLANRHTGVGFDQLLWIESSKEADFACRFFNADGSEAEQCGNGLRCVARFIREEKLTEKNLLSIATKAGKIEIVCNDFNAICVTMGHPSEIKIIAIDDKELITLSMGNPHAILRVDNIATPPVVEWGQHIATHHLFPQGTNVGFVEVVNQHHIFLRTFERGVGETYACGSNACAAAVAGIHQGWLTSPVQVESILGSLAIEWQENHPVVMTGPAVRVFQGVIMPL